MFNPFGGGPEPLPEHKAQQQFWEQLTKFMTFAVAAASVSALVKHIEIRAHEAISS